MIANRLLARIIFHFGLAFFLFDAVIDSKIMAKENEDIEKKVDEILAQLTLEEKIALFHGNSLFSSAGVERLGIPELAYTDGPFGIREELKRDSFAPAGITSDSATFFPTGPALAATWNVSLALEYGKAIGAEARARGKDILLGPGVNIIRTPVCGRNFDYFTEDPFLNARLAVAYIQGVQSQDVIACIKHYAVNNQETNRNRVDVQMDERTLREIYLPVYQAAVQEANVMAVMGAYNKFRGFYLCENDYLLNKVLKDEWGFRGIVISDWGATHSTVAAAKNGLDVEMGSFGRRSFFASLLDSVKAGVVDMSVIDEKARRVLRVMLSCKKLDPNRLQGSLNAPEHSQVAYQVASEAVILLKNSEGLLPLNMSEIKSIAVIGDNATQTHASGGFGAGVKARYEVTPLQGLENRFGESVRIEFALGYKKQYLQPEGGRRWGRGRPDNTPDSSLIGEAVKLAGSCDVAVIFAGSNRNVESEAWDRADLRLPFGQEELIEAVASANPRTIIFMIAGAPFDLRKVEKTVSTMLWSSFNGSEAGNAYADILSGKVNPSGKLPFTIPASLGDSPAHALNIFPGENMTANYEEGLLVGYRWFDTKKIKPLYCFGHGLSFTDFKYSAIKSGKKKYKKDDPIKLSLKLQNTGKFPGAETIQVYAQDVQSSVMRPEKELKGIGKVMLKPGEEKKVEINLKARDLAFYDPEKKEWVVEAGDFNLLVGSSSQDIRGSVVITISQ